MIKNAARSRPASPRAALRALFAAAAAVAALAVGVSLSGAATGTSSAVGTTNPPSLFNAFYFGTEGATMFSLTTHHILQPGVFGNPTTGPEAAVASWRAVNPTTYVYRVKTGIRFSDGSRMTARDVAFSLNVHKDPKTGSRMFSFFNNVRSITASGNNVTVRLIKPDSKWQYTPAASPAPS